jgi:hypothetical protein
MAQEQHIGTARALDDSGDEDSQKADLQRQMEETRESITNTVNEIKDTVTTQYQHVKETVTEALDWREQFRRRPVAWSVGALSVGFVVGYGIAGVARGDRSEYYESTSPDYEEQTDRDDDSHLQAGQIVGSRTPYRATSQQTSAYNRPSYSSGYVPPTEAEREEGPGLVERFKGTRAYDRLQDEIGILGNRFVDQLSTVGQEVILPALLAKLGQLIGMDLSSRENRTTSSYSSNNPARTKATSESGAGSRDPVTSANQGYRMEAKERDAYQANAEVPEKSRDPQKV